jgi:hypothetical protein
MSSDRITEAAQHELDVIDAIVRGGGEARPEDAALTDFALLLRNARPVPNHGEAAALDARAAQALPPRKPKQRLVFKPVFAGVCALILVVGVTGVAYISSSSESGSQDEGAASPMIASPTNDSSTATSSGNVAKSAESAQAIEALPAPVVEPGGITSSQEPRDVARDTRLTLAADGDEIERLADRVNAIVDRFGGYVASSQVRVGEGDRGRATFALMIPAAQYKPAMASISKLAHVRSRAQASEDITTQVNSADRVLKLATSRVNRIEDQLAVAKTPQQAVILRRNLASAKAAQRQAARQVRSNRARVNYVPIALTIVADKTAADKDKGTIAKAFDKAGTILTSIAAVLIILLAVLIPLSAIVAAIWFGMRRWNRVRSERTIEAAAAPQAE